MMSGHQYLFVGQPVGDGREVRLRASGTSTYSAWVPSIVLPKRQPPMGL
jgi:hypothetical protein